MTRSPENTTAVAPAETLTPGANMMPLGYCGLDAFEEGLLPLLRHFMICLAEPERQTWQLAFKIAAERWGETPGLAVANSLFKLIQFTAKARREDFATIDPLDIDARGFVTRDEQVFLQMLHHMRRDQTPQAREAVADVTGCTMDPDVIRAGLSFADRFPAGDLARRSHVGGKPQLRVVG